MRCRSFEQDLPDWIAGKLNDSESAEMRIHAATCAACAGEESFERRLRANINALPSPRERDILARLSDRIETTTRQRRWTLFPLPPRWATVGTTLAAAALCAAMYVNKPSAPKIDSSAAPEIAQIRSANVDESRVVHLVAAMRETADPDSDYTIDTANHVPSQQRAVLVGSGSR